MKAAHPQRTAVSDEKPRPVDEPAAGGQLTDRNPFPTHITAVGTGGEPVRVELTMLEGVMFAPHLDTLPLSPEVRQYVTQFCAMWSGSVLTTGKVRTEYPTPPRRGQLRFTESQLHAMLGLADDESLVAVVVDPLTSSVRFVVESPRLAPKEWNSEPPGIGLPISAWYEGRTGDGHDGGLDAAQRQLAALQARSETSQREWADAIGAARRRVDALRADTARAGATS